MRRLSAALLVLAPLTLAACSTLSVESEAHLLQPAPALTRTLVVVELSGASRRVAEDTLVARLASLHPAASYETVALQRTRDSFDVEGYSALYPALIRSGSEALERRLGLSARGPAEALSNARNRRPSEPRLVEVKALLDDVDLHERARKDGFDGLLVVRLNRVTFKHYPHLEEIPESIQIQTRIVASLTALDGDLEIWKGIVTIRDAGSVDPHLARKTAMAFADHLREDGVAN